MRCMSSRVLAPVAAVSVLQVCRRSWKRRASIPTALHAARHLTDQLDRRSGAPLAPVKTSASGSGPT